MILLIRTISAYTHFDQLLAITDSEQKALVFKKVYIEEIASGTKSDLWAQQSYHNVDLEKDINTISIAPSFKHQANNNSVYIVSAFTEGFGQVRRSFEYICQSEAQASEKIAELESNDDGMFPFYCEASCYETNTLLEPQFSPWILEGEND